MTYYKNASYTLSGFSCLVLFLNSLFWRMGDTGHSLVPGFSYAAGLAYPILSAWVGILLRAKFNTSKWWIRGIVLCSALVLVFFYRQTMENWSWEYESLLCLSLVLFGYLNPSKELEKMSDNQGWNDLVLAVISIFCYTAIAVVRQRILWGQVIPEHTDMEKLLECLLGNTEPLLAFVAVYFVIHFSFSKIGLAIGSQSWARGILWIPCVFVFIWVFVNTIVQYHYTRFYSLIMILVQPLFVYLVIVAARSIKKWMGKSQLTWKEVFSI